MLASAMSTSLNRHSLSTMFQKRLARSSPGRPEKPPPVLAARPPPPAAIVPRAADGPRPPGWNGQPRRHGSSRFNVQHHNQELVKLPPIKGAIAFHQEVERHIQVFLSEPMPRLLDGGLFITPAEVVRKALTERVHVPHGSPPPPPPPPIPPFPLVNAAGDAYLVPALFPLPMQSEHPV
ncbi:unnamed protein product, partial [Iphiclides podalirius]